MTTTPGRGLFSGRPCDPDKEIHILSLTFDSFFMSNIDGSSDFARLFPFLSGG